jgi:transposase
LGRYTTTEAIKAVFPHARFQADPFHTVKNIWGHLKKSLLSYRRKIKASGEEKNEEQPIALAKKLWTWRWSLLKKPGNLSAEEKQALAELESEDEGFVHRFRSIIRQLGNSFDHAHSEAQAKRQLQQLRKDIQASTDHHLEKIPQFFDDHWEQALRYLRQKGISTGVGPTPSRGCVCSAGLRKIMTGSGLQQPGSTTFRSIRRSSTSPSTLPIL